MTSDKQMGSDKLEREFHNAMINIYKLALSECRYRATRFLQLTQSRGGLAAAKELLKNQIHSQGLVRLWECGRLDISMEALVLQEPWCVLFDDTELAMAKNKLEALGYNT